MIVRTRADADWEERFGRRDLLVSPDPLLTIDVERAWLIDRPVLFIGHLKDVGTDSDTEYTVRIDHGTWRATGPAYWATELQLELTCDKAQVDAIVAAQTDRYRSFSEIAVVATVEHISREERTDSDDGTNVVFTGRGRCIELLSLGRVGLEVAPPLRGETGLSGEQPSRGPTGTDP